jgi:hypothetical protein
VRRTGATATEGSHPCVVTLLISSADFSNTFVARGEECNGDQGKDEREDASDMPLPKYDAEVLG